MLPMGDVQGVLTDLEVDQDTIHDVMTMLYQYASDLGDAPVTDVGEDAFGASWLGSNLGYHTRLAQSKLAEAMQNMMDNLTGVGDTVGKVADDIVVTDTTIESSLKTIVAGMDCVAVNGFEAPVCGPSGGDS